MKPEKREVQVRIVYAASTSTSLPYQKGDHVQLAQMQDDVALTFHQLDYQQIGEALAALSSDATAPIVDAPTQIIARLVMSREAFVRLIDAGQRMLASATTDPT